VDGAFVFFLLNVNLSKTTQSHPLEHLGSIPCLDTRFVAYLDVLAGVFFCFFFSVKI